MHIYSAQVGKKVSFVLGVFSALVFALPAPALADNADKAISGDLAVDEAVKFIQDHQQANTKTVSVQKENARQKKIRHRNSERHIYIMGGSEVFPL